MYLLKLISDRFNVFSRVEGIDEEYSKEKILALGKNISENPYLFILFIIFRYVLGEKTPLLKPWRIRDILQQIITLEKNVLKPVLKKNKSP